MVRRRERSRDDTPPPDRAALRTERAELVARLREIDRVITPGRERAVITPPETRGQSCR